MRVQKALLVLLLVAVLLGTQGVFTKVSADEPICRHLPPATSSPSVQGAGTVVLPFEKPFLVVSHTKEYFVFFETDSLMAYVTPEKTLASAEFVSRCDVFVEIGRQGNMVNVARVYVAPGMKSNFDTPYYIAEGSSWIDDKWFKQWDWRWTDASGFPK